MIEYSSDITVKLVRAMASDDMVVQAAQVSAKGENKPDTVPERLVNALLKDRHGSPFEHTMFTFFVEAPIFVVREWQTHRISSINEMSGRYTTFKPKFYIPDFDRPIINGGTKMRPAFVFDWDFDTNQKDLVRNKLTQGSIRSVSRDSWRQYEAILKAGVANEVARMVLPVNVYTQLYWTINARSLMNFLSLRVESDDSMFRSHPQYEMDLAACKIERYFEELMPLTHKAFVANGRVAP